jgi:hypothetical protein
VSSFFSRSSYILAGFGNTVGFFDSMLEKS